MIQKCSNTDCNNKTLDTEEFCSFECWEKVNCLEPPKIIIFEDELSGGF
jgi:hypothetical protein